MEEIHDLSSSSRPATPQSASPPASVQSNEPEGTVVRVHGCFACCCYMSYVVTLGSHRAAVCSFSNNCLVVHDCLVVYCGCMTTCCAMNVESAWLIGVAAGGSSNGIRSDWRRSSIQAGPGS